MAMWTAPRRLYLTKDGSRVVEEGDPDAAALLIGEGGQMLEEDARRYGLLDAPETKARERAPETKQVDHPPENKSRRER